MFFRDVVFGRLPASILEGFWLDLDGLGPPSWSHVGLKLGLNWALNCDFWRLLGDLGALNWL